MSQDVRLAFSMWCSYRTSQPRCLQICQRFPMFQGRMRMKSLLYHDCPALCPTDMSPHVGQKTSIFNHFFIFWAADDFVSSRHPECLTQLQHPHIKVVSSCRIWRGFYCSCYWSMPAPVGLMVIPSSVLSAALPNSGGRLSPHQLLQQQKSKVNTMGHFWFKEQDSDYFCPRAKIQTI